jgi:ubiquinone/menaquinone biosynthesis C-methylase UbiE
MAVDLRRANELFHDCESNRYDDKWGIRYDLENAVRVRKKFEKVYGKPFPHVYRLLEVGCGTGYVGLNLYLNEGIVDELYACDISQGMVEACRKNAAELGVPVRAKRSELEKLAYGDEEFDMVIGHAILHHIPDISRALAEIYRVLTPGGMCMLAGEPTRMGDHLGQIARTGTSMALKWYSELGGYFGGLRATLKPEPEPEPHGDEGDIREFEKVVDIHTFKPAEVCRAAREVGFCEARFETEELLSSFVGWITRTVENKLSDDNLTFRWRYWSYTTYLRLNELDDRIYPYLPSSLFYNMLLFLRKPDER